jgi:hypothetical protein
MFELCGLTSEVSKFEFVGVTISSVRDYVVQVNDPICTPWGDRGICPEPTGYQRIPV